MTNADVEQIRSLDAERVAASLTADVPILERLLHPNLGYGHTNTARDTKDDLLEKFRTGRIDYQTLTHEISDVVIEGDTALTVGQMSAMVMSDGRTLDLRSVALCVWVRVGGSWQMIAFQPTPVPR